MNPDARRGLYRLPGGIEPRTAGRARAGARLRAVSAPFLLLAFFLVAGASAQEMRGPLLRWDSAPLSFDTTYCGTTKRIAAKLANVGNMESRIAGGSFQDSRFRVDIPTTLLQPGDSILIPMLYRPAGMTHVDSAAFEVDADQRRSLSLCLLVDVSASMQQTDVYDSVSGFWQARFWTAMAICENAIMGMFNGVGVEDEGAVIQFAGPGDYSVNAPFTSDTPRLLRSIPTHFDGLTTCLYDALQRAVEVTAHRRGTRAILLITDGQNTCPGPPSLDDVIWEAQRSGVRIFSVGLGNPDVPALQRMAVETGGEASFIYALQDAPGAFRRMVHLVSRDNRIPLRLQGTPVAPRPMLSPEAFSFDTIRIGTETCGTLTVGNSGTAPFSGTITLSHPAMHIRTPADGTLRGVRPGESRTVEICFTPDRTGETTARLQLSSLQPECEIGTAEIPLHGGGSEPISLSLPEKMTGKPGSTIAVPVRLGTILPTGTGVTRFSASFRYNRTMLHPLRSYTGGDDESLVAGAVEQKHETVFFGEEAVTTYTFSGGRIINGTKGSLLFRPAFLVLQGNARRTPVTVEAPSVDNGYYTAGAVPLMIFTADSLCDQDQRLIDPSARYATTVGQSVPNPVSLSAPNGGTAFIRYSLAGPGRARLVLYHAMGQAVRILVDDERAAGEYYCPVDTAGLAPGVYFYLFEAGGHREMKKLLVTK